MIVSTEKLIVVFKNFFRNRYVNLTAKSIKFFCPNAELHCLNLFKYSKDEYDSQEQLDIVEQNIFYSQTKYILDKNETSVAYPQNNSLFSEGYNIIFERFKNYEDKVVFSAEDHFYTNGHTLAEIIKSDFDICICPWGTQMNASMFVVRPKFVSHCFPISETGSRSVEDMFRESLLSKILPHRIHRLSTREHIDYRGDGFYTNNADDIEKSLKENHII